MKIKHRNPKLHLNFLLIILFLVPTFYSCKDDLPRETHDGRNTFGMLIDGEEWESSTVGSLNVNAYYYPSSKSVMIRAKHESRNEMIVLVFKNVEREGEYIISEQLSDPLDVDSTRFVINNDFLNSFLLKNESASKATLSKLDLNRKIISGKFELQLSNNENEMLEITDGRFDITLIIPD